MDQYCIKKTHKKRTDTTGTAMEGEKPRKAKNGN